MTSAALFLAWAITDVPLGDAARLPPIGEIRAAIDFNQRCQRRLDWLIDYEPYGSARREAIKAVVAEIEQTRVLWDCAWGAHPEYRPYGDDRLKDEARRTYLRRLRLALGRDAYERMDLGPAVPEWYFRELR